MFPATECASLSPNPSNGLKPKYLKQPVRNEADSAVIRSDQVYSRDQSLRDPSFSDSVVAYEFLEKDTISNGIDTADLMARSPPGRVELQKSPDGLLRPMQKIRSWIRSVNISPDIYTHNAVIELTPAKEVRLRISKNLSPGEEVVAWFSGEISILMNIPFLTPANIIDNKCYMCHFCKTTFESPNPLKIHIASECSQQPMDALWIRLHYCIDKGQPPAIHHSVFGPISNTALNFSLSASSFLPIATSPSLDPIAISKMYPAPSLPVTSAAQIETMVSNMGSSKQGHLCIYCGKIYSRKYGLKIHIRTHTGFKPLKCKFCLRPFGDPSNLNKHVRLHMQAGKSIFKCHLCHKIMIRRRDLHRHLQSRHRQRMLQPDQDSTTSEET